MLGLGGKSEDELHAENVLKILQQRGVLRKVDKAGKNGARRWVFREDVPVAAPPPRVLPGVAAADPGVPWYGGPEHPLIHWWDSLHCVAVCLDELECFRPPHRRLIEERLGPELERLAGAGLSDAHWLLGSVCLLLAANPLGAGQTFGVFVLGASRAAEVVGSRQEGSASWQDGAAGLAALERAGLIRCVERGRPGKGCSRWEWVADARQQAVGPLRIFDPDAAVVACWN